MIFDYLNYRRLFQEDQDDLLNWLVERALEHDKPVLLVRMASERLHYNRIIRPGLTVVERLIKGVVRLR